MIWEETLREPRELRFHYVESHIRPDKLFSLHIPKPPPATLAVCFESREIALRRNGQPRYRPWDVMTYGRGRVIRTIMWNPDVDIVSLLCEQLLNPRVWPPLVGLFAREFPNEVQNIKTLALQTKTWRMPRRSCLLSLVEFRNLRQLVVMINDDYVGFRHVACPNIS